MAKDALVVPMIDLANFPAELEKLAAAITNLGFFQVTNHGMPAALMAEMKETAQSLFELPADVKKRNVISNLIDGNYRPRNFEPKAKYFESFSVYDAASLADVHSFCSVLELSPQQRCALLYSLLSPYYKFTISHYLFFILTIKTILILLKHAVKLLQFTLGNFMG